MKILAIHNYHRTGSASGDDLVFKNETELLEQHGVEVIRYTVSNDTFDKKRMFGKFISTMGMMWSFKHYYEIKKIIKEHNPDIVHIHTFFPLLSPSVLYAAKRSNVKVVATLHDTRFICPCATSLNGTKLCNACGDGHYFRMVRNSCFKQSKIQSLIVAMIFKYHRMRKSFYNQIDKYICLNDNQIELLKNIGFDQNKIVKKYNFIPDIVGNLREDNLLEIHSVNYKLPERYVVFYGRLGVEKGIYVLMQIWNKLSDIPLVVMGDGPLADVFNEWAKEKDNVQFFGYIEHNKCLSIIKGAEFVVFPSIWYEGCSMVEVETESLGKALIATDLGFSMEAIENGINGYKVPLGDIDEFRNKVIDLWNNPELAEDLGMNARKDYEEKYLPEDNYEQLLNIYSVLM